MKGVIVQIGEPKSIVLYNNGRISAIPTPAGCHLGMVVTVKFNNKLKTLVLAFAAVLLLALGVVIGAELRGGGAGGLLPVQVIHDPATGPVTQAPQMSGRDSMMARMTRRRQFQSTTVSQVRTLGDDALVILSGNIVESLGDGKYTFRDPTGDITVEIDRKIWRGLPGDVSGTVEISGEVDIEKGRAIIDVETVRIK